MSSARRAANLPVVSAVSAVSAHSSLRSIPVAGIANRDDYSGSEFDSDPDVLDAVTPISERPRQTVASSASSGLANHTRTQTRGVSESGISTREDLNEVSPSIQVLYLI